MGWAWHVRAISSALAPNSIARANSAIIVPATALIIETPKTLSVFSSAIILTKPSVSELIFAREFAKNGNFPILYLIFSFFKKKHIGLATARAGNVIGGGDWSADRLIPDAVKTWSKNEKLIIRYPQATRPWQHVLEPLSGYLMLAEALWKKPEEFSGAWNFGPDQNSVKTVQEMVERAASEWDIKADWEASQDNHPHEASLLQLNSKKAKSMIGWKPHMNFEKAVSEINDKNLRQALEELAINVFTKLGNSPSSER